MIHPRVRNKLIQVFVMGSTPRRYISYSYQKEPKIFLTLDTKCITV